MRDDHDIVESVGPDGSYSFAEALGSLKDTELGAYGKAKRYRPVYWILRKLEYVAWGDNPILWHTARVVSAFVACFVLFWLSCTCLRGPVGFSLALWVSSRLEWTELFASLGTAEFYAICGIIVFCFGFLLFKSRSKAGAALVLLGFFVMAGAKENFIAMTAFLPILLLTATGAAQKKIAWFVCCVGGAYAIFILFGFLPEMLTSKKDIYANEVGTSDRFLGGLSWRALIPVGAFVYFLLQRRFLGPKRQEKEFLSPTVALVGAMCVVYFFNVYFHGSLSETVLRYRIPSHLILALCVAMVLRDLLSFINKMAEKGRGYRYAPWIAAGSLLIVVAGYSLSGYAAQREEVSRRVKETNRLSLFVEEVARRIVKENRVPVLVLDLSEPVSLQYEYLHTLSSYIRNESRRSEPLPLYFLDDGEAPMSALDEKLLKGMRRKRGAGKHFRELSERETALPQVAIAVRGNIGRKFENVMVWNDWQN